MQFRYAFVVDREGLKVFDITRSRRTGADPNVKLPIADARNIYVARTYAYISAGKQGIAIVNVEQPEHPKLDQIFNAEGELNDINDLKIGMVSSSQFAFVADGKNGMQDRSTLLASGTRQNSTASVPSPFQNSSPAIQLANRHWRFLKGIDRDRAVDETGNQLAVFGRRGSRPLNLTEMQSLYLRKGELYTVTDTPASNP